MFTHVFAILLTYINNFANFFTLVDKRRARSWIKKCKSCENKTSFCLNWLNCKLLFGMLALFGGGLIKYRTNNPSATTTQVIPRVFGLQPLTKNCNYQWPEWVHIIKNQNGYRCSDTFMIDLGRTEDSIFCICLVYSNWAVVVAKLAKRLLPTPEVRGLNPITSKVFIKQLLTVNCIEKKKRKKWPGIAHF